MTNPEIIAELEGVRADYQRLLALIGERRRQLDETNAAIDELGDRVRECYARVLRTLEAINAEMGAERDEADWWKN